MRWLASLNLIPIGARYLNSQVLGIFVATLAVLLSIALGDRLIRLMDQAASGGIPGDLVLYLVMLRLPEMLQLVLPFALYIALLMGLGRLYSSEEMSVLRSGGLTTGQLLAWLAPLIFAVTVLVAAAAIVMTPTAKHSLDQELIELQQRVGLAAVQPGVFRIEDKGDQVVYSGGLADDNQTILDVFIQRSLPDGRQMTVWAERGIRAQPAADGRQHLILERGRRYVGSAGDPAFEVMSFQRLNISIDTNPIIAEVRDVDSLPTGLLDTSPAQIAEWHWRMGLPIFCLILALLAIAKSPVQPRSGQFARVGPGLVWMLAYYLALVLNRWLIDEGHLGNVIGFWPVHLGFGVYTLAMLGKLGQPAKS